ncbi:MAG: LysR substrate-binding domain-containing protein [Acidimicrobiia bacterium]|nr:LysR substrate-binding domain-containing protein [Acidimicrobiia bacterium]
MTVSDRWLRTFAAVAESGSFTAAARKLGVGQPATSHAVARLESALGVQLLERSTRGLTMTAAGRLLYRRLAVAFAEVDDAVEAARRVGTNDVVSLSVSTSLANFWLLPRLPDFKRRHPDIDLRVITTDSDDAVGLDDADLWIPLGLERPQHLEATLFRVERIVPVAAPTLARRLFGGRRPDPGRLLEAPLLHLEERYRPRYNWERWFADHDIALRSSLGGYRSNDYSLVLQAALDGQGIALGWEHIVTALLDDDRLVSLATPIETDQPFPILQRTGLATIARSGKVEALRNWLRDTA